jgi:hypothetical protein
LRLTSPAPASAALPRGALLCLLRLLLLTMHAPMALLLLLLFLLLLPTVHRAAAVS